VLVDLEGMNWLRFGGWLLGLRSGWFIRLDISRRFYRHQGRKGL